MTTTPKLKPCPFCGRRARNTRYFVECSHCGASIPQTKETREELIARWNRRRGEKKAKKPCQK
jgi:Lar family restriction alleviation protein